MDYRAFSVLLSTYEGDSASELRLALASLFDQTVSPDEVIVVTDGPITSGIEEVLDSYQERHAEVLRTVSLPTNQGLGAALRQGVEACSHELIARMDSDDIAVRDRFEQQLEHFDTRPNIDVLGGYVGEFEDDPDKLVRIRSVPTTPDGVRSTARFRCPTNHPTVMFRRQSVLDAGNYRQLRLMQDYDLWMRMLAAGYTIENLPKVLVKFRTGDDLYTRRGGLSYARDECVLQREFLRYGAISFPVFLINLCIRVPIRLVPDAFRRVIYKRLLRK